MPTHAKNRRAARIKDTRTQEEKNMDPYNMKGIREDNRNKRQADRAEAKIKAKNFNEFAQRAGFVSNPNAVQRTYSPSSIFDTSGAEADRIWNSGARDRFEPVAMARPQPSAITGDSIRAAQMQELSYDDYRRQLERANNTLGHAGRNLKAKFKTVGIDGDVGIKGFVPTQYTPPLSDFAKRTRDIGGKVRVEVGNEDKDVTTFVNPDELINYGDGQAIRNSAIQSNTQVVQKPVFSGGQGTTTVDRSNVAPVVTFQEFQDLNKIARNPDYEVGQEVVPPSQDVPIHPVTGLRIEKGDNWNSYTDAPSGTTFNNENFNWNNKGFKTPTGNVDGLSQQEIDVLYGRTPSPVQPKQEVDFSSIANFFRNLGK